MTNFSKCQMTKMFQKNQAEDIGHLLSEELAQMDQAIADATKRISEIFAKSRGSDEGVKLEVYEHWLRCLVKYGVQYYTYGNSCH